MNAVARVGWVGWALAQSLTHAAAMVCLVPASRFRQSPALALLAVNAAFAVPFGSQQQQAMQATSCGHRWRSDEPLLRVCSVCVRV